MRKIGFHLTVDGDVRFANSFSLMACAKAFQILYEDAQFLFQSSNIAEWMPMGVQRISPSSHATAKQVAKHIRKYIEERGAYDRAQ